MEMSKSPKPRHFSDSSRERWDKNRHEQRTKSYLKRKKRGRGVKKNSGMCVRVCHVTELMWSNRENARPCEMVERREWWAPACLSAQGNPIISICLHSNRRASGAADTMTTSVLQEHPSYPSSPPRLLSPPIISINCGCSILHVALKLLELCWLS